MEISQFSLGLPTILRKVLEQLSTKELIKLSRVSKLWNYEARSVMKERGSLTAKLRRGGVDSKIRQRRIMAFASCLDKMPVVPFTGIQFHMYHRPDCQSISSGSLEPSYKVISERIPWKHFSVRFYDDSDRCKDCPPLAFVKKVLEEHCGVLEELNLGFGQEKFLRPILQGRSLPCLKSLTIESMDLRSVTHCVTSAFIKALVSRAPNLQELHVGEGVDLTVNVLEGSSAVLVPVPEFKLRPLVKPICEGLIGSIRANSLDICIQTNEIDPRLLKRFIPTLLEASRNKLNVLWMDLLFAVPLMCYGICLENVTTLFIYINGHVLEAIDPYILNLTRGLDFTRVFPKLTEVKIFHAYFHDFSSGVVNEFVVQGTAVLSRALPDRATNIHKLELVAIRSIRPSSLSLLAQLFPDVQTVQVEQTPGCSFETLREHFQCLETVIDFDIF